MSNETTEIYWQDGAKIAELAPAKRWVAKISYHDLGRGDLNPPWVEYVFDELSDLHAIVEGGPNFYAIAKIEIVINPGIDRKSMVEAAR